MLYIINVLIYKYICYIIIILSDKLYFNTNEQIKKKEYVHV
jgi:hypothetical protein